MNFCKLWFAVLLFLFANLKPMCFSGTPLYHSFSLRKNKIENADYASDTKTEIKVSYPWCGIIYFFGP